MDMLICREVHEFITFFIEWLVTERGRMTGEQGGHNCREYVSV